MPAYLNFARRIFRRCQAHASSAPGTQPEIIKLLLELIAGNLQLAELEIVYLDILISYCALDG